MMNMVYMASAFNQPIGEWNSAAVTNMTYMFYDASAFDQPSGERSTAAVTNMMSSFVQVIRLLSTKW